MRINRKAMLAAGLITGAALMTGCTADTKVVERATPQAVQQQKCRQQKFEVGCRLVQELSASNVYLAYISFDWPLLNNLF